MRVLVVHPGPAWSVADVADGWARAFRDIGCDTAVYDFDYRLNFYDRAYIKTDDGEFIKAFANDTDVVGAAIEVVGNQIFKLWPDLVVFVSAFWVPMDLLDMIRAHGIQTVLLGTESPYEDDRHCAVASRFDAVVLNDPTNCERAARVNPRTFYAPHSYDPKVHFPGPAVDEFRSDVVMVGSGYPSRVEFLHQVDWSGIDLALRGNWSGLEHHPLKKFLRQPELNHCCDNSETVDWYRSTKIGVNLYRKEANAPDLIDGWSMGPREVELAASGTFYVTEARGENRAVLPMVPTFSTPKEFEELVRYYLDRPDERQTIADAARAAVAGWTFQDRARKLLACLYPTK